MREHTITIIFLVLVFAFCLATAYTAEEASPLYQEDFETLDPQTNMPAGWTHYSTVRTVSVTTEKAHGGTNAFKLVDNDAKLAVGMRSPHIKVTPGLTCWVEYWYYGEIGNNQSLYIEFWTADGKRPENPSRSFGAEGNGKWTKFVQRSTVPEGTASITIHMNSYSTNQATGYFDDISFGIGPRSVYDRSPRPPADVKHPCTLYKQADVDRAKANYDKHEWAKAQVNSFINGSQFWLNCSDEDLKYWIPDLTPFRVVDCPKCGAGWRFAWGGDDKQIRCLNCGFTWPNADYPEDKTQEFLDPVGGTQAIPYYEGEPSKVYGSAKSPIYRLSGRLRFHRINKLGSLGNLGKAYVFTEDVKYAEQVRKVLLRLAEVYPHYLAHDWGRIFDDYSNLQSGKLSGWKLHDTGTFTQLAIAYDLTYNSGVYSDEDKVAIEEGCFREFSRLMTATAAKGCCINDGPAAMAGGALAGLILGDHDTIAWAIERPDGFLGFINDYFYRDGHWYEGSPSYEGMTLGPIYVAPEALRGYSDPASYTKPDRYDNLDLFQNPVIAKLLTAGAPETMPDGNLPPTNDSTFGARYPRQRTEQQYYWYPTDENLALMAWAFGGKVGDSGGEYTLFRRDPDLDFEGVTPADPSGQSVVRPGVGYSILRTGAGNTDAAMLLDYGPHGSGHGHPDRMNILYYDFGTEMLTDLGYLGAGHPNHPWIRSTASHNLVLVDGRAQLRSAGELEAFGDGGAIKACIANAPTTYNVDTYRRNVIFVDHGPGKRYLVDLFHVAGAEEFSQYAFHAAGEIFTPPLFDYQDIDPKSLGYDTAGYTYLKSAKQADAPLPFICEWIADPETNLGTRLHMMGQEGTKLTWALADGLRNRSDAFGKTDMYCIYAQRDGAESTFLSVIEAFKGESALQQARELTVNSENGEARAVEVRYADFTDIAIIADENAASGMITIPEYPALAFMGRMAHVSIANGEAQELWMMGGEKLAYGTAAIEGVAKYEGEITAVSQDDFSVTADLDIPGGEIWAGEHMLVAERSDGAYLIDDIVPGKNGSVTIKFADRPSITCEAGDYFTIIPNVSASRQANGVWQLKGRVAKLSLVDGDVSPDGIVKVNVNGSRRHGRVYSRVPGGTWQPIDHTIEKSTVSVSLSPDKLDSGEIWLYLGNKKADLADTQPPMLEDIAIDGKSIGDIPDAGYQRSAKRVDITLSDENPLSEAATRAVLVGEASGTVPVSTHFRALKGQNTGKSRITVRPRTGKLSADTYTLQVQASDILANTLSHKFTFNTSGYSLPFETMASEETSGQVLKSLGGEFKTMFFRAEEPGNFVTFRFVPPITGRAELTLVHTLFEGYGTFQTYLDDQKIGDPIDQYTAGLKPGGGIFEMGEFTFENRPYTIRLETVGKNPKAATYYMGISELRFVPMQ